MFSLMTCQIDGNLTYVETYVIVLCSLRVSLLLVERYKQQFGFVLTLRYSDYFRCNSDKALRFRINSLTDRDV